MLSQRRLTRFSLNRRTDRNLPTAPRQANRSARAGVEAPSSRPKIRLALADDHPIFRDALHRLLSLEADFDVVAEASDGDEVIEALQKHQPDILLLDLMMPRLDGLSVLQLLRSHHFKTKTIMLTASEDRAYYTLAMKYGAAGIVAKKEVPGFLVEGIRRVQRGEMCLDDETMAMVMRQFSDPMEKPPSLSRRGKEVVSLVSQGRGNKEIPDDLFVRGRLQMETELRRALERQEFRVHYQSIVSLQTGQIDGFEALVRWDHPEQGLIPPRDFIPVAEETGLIVRIGEWVLRTVCAQASAWAGGGYPHIRASVNLSSRQLNPERLVESVTRALQDTGLAPHLLQLELTESRFMDDVEQSVRTFTELSSMGVRIALDDFGTGASSLSYLRSLPVHTLKMDGSFLREVGENPDAAGIVSAIIDLAHNLRLTVIAECVSTDEQLRFLRSHHCDAIQGSLFSWPVPPETFTSLLQEGRRLTLAGPPRSERAFAASRAAAIA